MSKNNSSQSSNQASNTLIHILSGSAVTSILFFVLLLIGAALIIKLDLSSGVLPAVTFAASALAALCGGFAAVRKERKNGAARGVLSAVPAIIAMIIASVIASKSQPGTNMLISSVIMLAFGALGGIIAANMRKKIKNEKPAVRRTRS